MNQNQLNAFMKTALANGFAALNIACEIKQDYQPTKQGANSQPTVYYHFLGNTRYGYLKRKYTFDTTTGITTRTEEQPLIARYQINAKAIQNPANVTQLTASDYVDLAAYVLNNDETLAFFLANNINAERIRNGRQTFFKDDIDRFEADPSYDFTCVHTSIITSVLPSTAKINSGIYPV